MTTMRLTPEHPVYQRLEALLTLADTLDLRIDFMGVTSTVTDTKTNQVYKISCVESGESLVSWPPETEYKLTYKTNK